MPACSDRFPQWWLVKSRLQKSYNMVEQNWFIHLSRLSRPAYSVQLSAVTCCKLHRDLFIDELAGYVSCSTFTFAHRWLVQGWSPRHLLLSATGTALETGKGKEWPKPHIVERVCSFDLGRLACLKSREHPCTRQQPRSMPATAAAERITEAPPRLPFPSVDVAGRAGEIHSGPGTTATFCSPNVLS